MRPTRPPRRPRGSLRGQAHLRLRLGFVFIAMVLSVFGGRLVQLQGIDPNSYAEMAAKEGMVQVVLPAERGDILDRNGQPLAESVDGMMIVADPYLTSDQAPELARFLARHLHLDYFSTLTKLRASGSRFEYIARRVPATIATHVVDAAENRGFKGLDTRRDPIRQYPGGDVAANLVGFMGTDEPLAGFERTFDGLLSGKDGEARYEIGGGTRIPLGESTITPAVDGSDLHTTIDQDLQWYTQRVLRQTVEDARAESGFAVVMDSRTGELLALADDPTFDANKPLQSPKEDLGSRAMSDPYEPGSVEKVLTISSLIDLGKVTPHTRLKVPGVLEDGAGHPIHDWFTHGLIHLTLAGVIAQSSNIGTVLASEKFAPGQLYDYLRRFGLGSSTDIGIRGESPGILPDKDTWTSPLQDRIAFGQSLSVNAVQMAAAVNTIANGGVRVDPSIIEGSATTDDGSVVGTDHTTTHRVVSAKAARGTMHMMERVVAPGVGVAPAAAVPGYRVAGKTGTAQRVNPDCGCYDGTFTVSFAGFAPADDPRFTIYVVVQNPGNGGGGGSVGGPAFSKIMGYALRRYGVPPTGTHPSKLPTTW
ncbi:penicillin-binding protein 2 [Nocardioides panaciterrulae]|uniref:Cell division protein FtsI (Penicillin-binding protein 3) n=1 Tax=Nocardioides panaciterrulae TaxID=661492 RepID=A0A7Y9E5Q1_9ACTN|nr:cell division protein FtsI (penicillin-binding protein 3) [Nocardioides panaciterrulae]